MDDQPRQQILDLHPPWAPVPTAAPVVVPHEIGPLAFAPGMLLTLGRRAGRRGPAPRLVAVAGQEVERREHFTGGVQQAITRVSGRCSLAIHSLAGDLALNDASWRETLHARGILTVGIPRTVEPLTPVPSQENVRRVLNETGLHGKRTPHQVPIACACGYSRPVVESIMASLLCRGAARITYKGHRGAVVQTGVTVMAHHAATLVRVQQNHLSTRAQKLRRLLRLKRHNVNEFNVSKN